MGNHSSHGASSSPENDNHQQSRRRSSAKYDASAHTPALQKLFQKLELTAESDNGHPGEITRLTFENVFHGPLHIFGKLLFCQMVSSGHHGSDKNKERISCEQFVKAGKEVLKLFQEVDQHKYYFKLFAKGKDTLEKEDALTMVNVAYSLTLSSSMIPYAKGPKDELLFQSVVQSMFGMKTEMKFQELEKWLETHCPHMFCGVHNWVYTILTGSKMPSELETAPVPQLEKFITSQHCMSLGVLWLLSATLPYMYTHTEKEGENSSQTPSISKNPLLSSYQFLMKLARLNRCQSWTLLYDSDQHGLSMNRFSHHVTSYRDATLLLLSFEGRNMYCLAMDTPWRDGSSKYGRENTVLLQLTPVYRIVQAGGPIVLWNQMDRNLPKGIQIGQTGKATVLSIPHDFDRLNHYGVECELHKVEMWGCGGREAEETQMKQKQWERKEVEKAKTRKLHMDVNWDENPDKAILSWGGVEVNHQYSRNGGM